MITVSKHPKLTTGLCVQRPTTKAGTKQTMGKSSKTGSRIDLPIQPGEVDEGGDVADHIPEDQWPKVARLSVGGLSQQSNIIREMCRDAIWIVEVALVTKHAWPELHKGTLYKRQVLLEAVDGLRANKDDNDGNRNAHYKVLHTRIMEDEKLVRITGKWVRNFT